MVGNHHTVDRLGGGGRPPTDDVGTPAVLIKNIPSRLGLAGQVGDGADATGGGAGFRKTMDAVFPGAFAGGDARPQHGREHRTDGSEVTPDPGIHQAF